MSNDKTRQDNDSAIKVYSQVVLLGNIYGKHFGTGFAGNVWDKNNISPCLTTMVGGGRQPHIIVEGKDV